MENAQPQQQGYSMQDLVIELTNRIRVLESKNSELGERMLVMNQNMIAEYKKLIREIKSLEKEIDDMKNDMNNMKNIIKHLTDEAKNFARKDSLKVLEKYINLWNPLTFVTPKDVRRIIEEELNKKNGKRTDTTD
ncbi:hypothetical protein D6777_04620 [Candidatus Woesearchaeota archaeon]|nr:MAG: hypothetical protein D6777_04620 [Candidatus Woesearchaeota archaeon]